MSDVASLLRQLDQVKKVVRQSRGDQIFSSRITSNLHELSATYFSAVKGELPDGDTDVAMADKVFTVLHDLSRKNPSKQKCLDALTDARRLLVRLEGVNLARPANRTGLVATSLDDEIMATLDDICQAAKNCYRQAMVDLATERHSWRGTATDLREALRETLDKLAPDADVESMPNYKPEPDAKRPTMKQKTRFILRNRDMKSGQIATSEEAVRHIEESLGGITRSVYTRSSTSTHTPTTKEEVSRLHVWVRVILCELLAIRMN
jgi:hypothetical protein